MHYEARLKSVNWYLQETHAGETDIKHGLFGGKAWFHPGEYVTSWNEKFCRLPYFSIDNAHPKLFRHSF
jgi:hypothetical protein